MREWKVKMVQIHKRYAELEVRAYSEQDAIEIAESILNEDPEGNLSDFELDDQFVEEIALI
jgi:hypothetical protein